MATLLGNTFSTNEKAVAQANLKLIGSTVESFVVKFDQEKFEKLISLGSISLKSTRQYRKNLFRDSHSSLFGNFSKKSLYAF